MPLAPYTAEGFCDGRGVRCLGGGGECNTPKEERNYGSYQKKVRRLACPTTKKRGNHNVYIKGGLDRSRQEQRDEGGRILNRDKEKEDGHVGEMLSVRLPGRTITSPHRLEPGTKGTGTKGGLVWGH